MINPTVIHKYSKVILAIFFIGFNISRAISCSCTALYFCEYLKEGSVKIAIEATVLHHKVYSQNDAVYLSVDKIFRDDVGITDTIKLYGESETADCHVDVLRRFPVGAKVYLIIGLQYNGEDWAHEYVNPDAIYENYWEVAPFSCLMILLSVTNNIVSGPILSEVREYPLSSFENHLQNCDYSLEELNSSRCKDLPFRVYPNPSEDGEINIVNQYRYTSINRIRIFDTAGRLLYAQKLDWDPFQKAKFDLKYSGLYIVEFQCEESTFYEKVIIE